MAKKSKQFSDYKPYTYLEGVGKDAVPVKFVAKNDEDAQLYVKKVGATSWKKSYTVTSMTILLYIRN